MDDEIPPTNEKLDSISSELSEKNFIGEKKKPPFPAWVWIILFTILIAILWGLISLQHSQINSKTDSSPFLQVTNRELSVFLWQHPALMRANVSNKSAYLPGFQFLNKVSMELEMADQYVVAPPEVIFLYHTWKRLVGDYYANRKITTEEFQEFLNDVKEWLPENWAAAPEGYRRLIASFKNTQHLPNSLEDLSENELPIIVRQAFQGWKNYFKEGESINKIRPTYKEMEAFLKEYPNFARNYWRNIVLHSAPNYLKTSFLGNYHHQELMPEDELDPLLKVSFFNYQQARIEEAQERRPIRVRIQQGG